MDNLYVGHSKIASKGPNGGQVKTAADGRTSDSGDPDMKALAKSVLQQVDLPSQEVRSTKVKVKVGGVTHTAHANSTGNAGGIKKRCAEGSSVSAKPPPATEGRRRRQRLILQENLDNEDDFPVRVEIQESPKKKPQVSTWASIAKMDIHHAKEDQKGQLVDEVTLRKKAKLTNNVEANQPVRKSSRKPKKRILDGEHYVDDDAEKALQNKISRTMKKCVQNGEYDEEEKCETRQRRSSRIPKKRVLDAEYEEDDDVHQHKRRWKRSKYQTDSEHIYHEDAEEAAALGDEDVEKTDVDLEGVKERSKIKQGVGNSTIDDNKEVTLTAQQWTMQSCKDACSEVGADLIEFPEGLPRTSQRKWKENLLEVEQQLKKTEAAQRRKMQLEKAGNAAQAVYQKILGKDSSRKK
jgi:INO80 complex subunit B